MNWNHVDDDLTREVLEGKRTDAPSIVQAINFAGDCLDADRADRDVPYEVWSTRAEACEEAHEWWNGGSNTEETVAALRRFWEN